MMLSAHVYAPLADIMIMSPVQALIGLMTYHRGATVHTQELPDLLVKSENNIQTVRSVFTLLCSCYTAHEALLA